jgi:two-component system phosphate regulon sensor histidine kinase PhoR
MPRSRFAWQIFTTLAVLTAAVLAGCFWVASVELARLADAKLLRRMSDAAEAIVPGDGSAVAPDAFMAAAGPVQLAARVEMSLLDLDGVVVASATHRAGDPSGTAPQRLLSAAALAEARAGRRTTASTYDVGSGRRIVTMSVPVGPEAAPTAIVQVSSDTGKSDRELAAAQRALLAGSAVCGAAALACAAALAMRVTRPIRDLAQAAARVAAGTFDTPLPTPEVADLAQLASALQAIRDQLVERGLTIGRQDTEQEAVLDSMIEGVLAIDARQRVVGINRAAADLLGLDLDTVVGRSMQDVIRNPALRRFALRAIDCRDPVEDDIIIPGVRDRTIRVRGTALRDVSGEGGAVIVLNDVTDLQRLETVRRDFVANVSHELKTPVASIKGFVETLIDGAAADPDDCRRFLGIIARQADRLEAIIEDLLALSRIEQSEGAGALPVEKATVAAVLQTAVNDCLPRATDRAIRLEVDCDADVEADVNAPLLEQAVINLIDNAIHASEAGDVIRVSALHEGDSLRIDVRDEGCGIPPEHLPRLFERFYRVDKGRSRIQGGTGLGLSIVKHIVQAHRGTVAVDSTPGVGSAFTIRLPA